MMTARGDGELAAAAMSMLNRASLREPLKEEVETFADVWNWLEDLRCGNRVTRPVDQED